MMLATIQDVVQFLNDMCEHAPTSMRDLVNMRIFCSYKMQNDARIAPHIVYSEYGTPTAGIVELLNALFDGSQCRIRAEFAERGDLIRFYLEDDDASADSDAGSRATEESARTRC